MKIHLETIKLKTLDSLLNEGPVFDPLAEAIRQLQTDLELLCSLNGFMEFCSGLGLDISRLEDALYDRAELMGERGLSLPCCFGGI